jgi:hypothetical protein
VEVPLVAVVIRVETFDRRRLRHRNVLTGCEIVRPVGVVRSGLTGSTQELVGQP